MAFQVVTMGRRSPRYAGKLFAENAYRDYLELHGLSVQLTEALAEYWHAGSAPSSTLPTGPRPTSRTARTWTTCSG